MGSHLMDQVLLLWLELFKVLTLSVAVTKSLWLQYHPWSKVIHMPLNVATADGCNISMLVVCLFHLVTEEMGLMGAPMS